jgi:hypothetical protein
MKKLSCITLIAVSMVILCSSCDISQDVYERNRGFDYPETLGDLKRHGIEDFESKQPGLGTAASYSTPMDGSTPGLTATIYIYNYGEKRIFTGIDNTIIKKAFRTAMNEIKEASKLGYYELTSSFSTETTYLIPSTQRTPALMAQFSLVEDGLEFISRLYVYGKNNQIVKVRVSNIKEEDTIVQPIRQSFLKAVAESIL